MWSWVFYDRVALYEIKCKTNELSSSIKTSLLARYDQDRLLYCCSVIIIIPTGTTTVLRSPSPPPHILWRPEKTISNPWKHHLYAAQHRVCFYETATVHSR